MKRLRRAINPEWDHYEYRCWIPFHATDAMGIVWHGNYLRFLEDARNAYFGERGISLRMLMDHGWSAPVVAFQLEYLRPATFDHEVNITVACKPNDKCLIELVYEIHDEHDQLLLRAESAQALVDDQGHTFLTRPPQVEAFFTTVAEHAAAARQEVP